MQETRNGGKIQYGVHKIKINWWHLSCIWMLSSFLLVFFVDSLFTASLNIHQIFSTVVFKMGLAGQKSHHWFPNHLITRKPHDSANKSDYDIIIICQLVFIFVLFLTRVEWNYQTTNILINLNQILTNLRVVCESSKLRPVFTLVVSQWPLVVVGIITAA